MSDAAPVALTDAITAVVNAAVVAESFETLGFTAVSSYPDWDDEFSDLKDLAVDVVFVSSPLNGTDLVELDSAGSINTDPEVDIVVRKRFEPSDRERAGGATGRIKRASINPLVKLVEQIHELVEAGRDTALDLGDGVSANWVDSAVRTYCDYKRLREGLFLGVVRVGFNVSKAN